MSKSNEQFDFSSSLSLTTIDDDNDDYAKSSYRRSNHQKRCWFWYDDCLNHWFKTISRTFILLIIIIIMSSLLWSTTNFVNCNVHSSSSYQFSYSSSSPLPSPTTTTTRKRSTILETKQIDQRIFVDKNIDIDDDIDGVRDNVALSSSSSTSCIPPSSSSFRPKKRRYKRSLYWKNSDDDSEQLSSSSSSYDSTIYEKHREPPTFALKLRNKFQSSSSTTMMITTTTTTTTKTPITTNSDFNFFHYQSLNDDQFMLADSPQIDPMGPVDNDDDDDVDDDNDFYPSSSSSSKKQRTRITRHRHKNSEKDFEIIGTLTGVAGGKIALPCNISTSTPKDSVSLILWYKDESTTPIYSVDARKGVSLEAARRVTDENLASRAYMNTGTNTGQTSSSSSPYAHLMLELLTPDDAGEYACRVDFRKERTRNSVIFLKIIVPPEKPQIIDTNGESLPSLIGPYTEGDHLTLICEVEGGKPQPSLTWWRESVLLDDTYEQITTTNNNQLIRNQLIIQSLRRQDLMAVFTCQASNNNISLPSTATVTVDLNFRPLTVKIIGERKQSLSAEKVSIITCESSGSRPPATITWWIGGTTRLRNAQEQISADGNKTTSRLSLTVTIDDIGKEITCRAENPHIQSSAIEDLIQLEINYAPQVTLKLGSNLRHSHIQEGNDVYFECVIRASPWSYEVRWHFEGRELQTNTSAGIIVSNQSLVLQKVRRQQRGKYTCSATNSEGDGESNAVHLRIQFSPICKAGQKIIYGAARHETVNIVCELESDPSEVEFFWSYNGTGSEPRRETATLKYETTGPQSSLGRYTPHTEFDYGTIYCWGRNSVGIQSKPCAYSIVAAGSPDPVRNCSVFNVTEDSMRVDCDEGYDGGLIQHFLLEIYDTTERNSALRANVTASTPQFYLNNLQSAHTYLFVIYAANAKGRSKGIALTAFTLAMPESMNRLAKGNVWQLNFNPVLVVLIAVVTGIVLIAFFIVLIVRWKTMKPPPNVSGSNGTSPTSSNANHRYHREMANEMTTKNALCTDDLDDLVLNGDDLDKQLTIPLNGCGGHHNHNNSSSPSSSVTATSTGANFIRSNNIYSAGPLSTTNNNNVNGMIINNKHVTWRPETPPSPNIYTQYTNIGYMPITPIDSIDSYQLISSTVGTSNNSNTHIPMSYTLSGLNNNNSGGGGGDCYETTFMDQQQQQQHPNHNYNHHSVPQQQQQQHSPYGVIVSDNNVVGVGNTMTNIPMSSSSYLSQQQQQQHNQLLSSLQNNNPYGIHTSTTATAIVTPQQQQQSCHVYGSTLPRRVRVIPNNNNNNNGGVGMGITTPLGIIPGIPGSSSIASSSSNGTTNSSSLGTTNHSQTTQSSSSSLLLHPTAINVGGGGNQYQFHHPSTTTNHNGLNINQQQQQQQQTPTSSSSSTTTNISDQSSAMTQV